MDKPAHLNIHELEDYLELGAINAKRRKSDVEEAKAHEA